MTPAAATPIAIILAALAGCATQAPTNQFAVAPGGYTAAFDAAREVLRDHRFRLDRIDAAAGVVSTDEKPSAGLATPWDLDQSTLRQEFSDFLSQQRRTVRITFEREGGGAPDAATAATGHVWVTLYRTQTAGLRVPSKATALTTITTNPQLAAQGTPAIYDVPVTRDSALEKRLAAEISALAAKFATQPQTEKISVDHSTGTEAIVGTSTGIEGFSPR